MLHEKRIWGIYKFDPDVADTEKNNEVVQKLTSLTWTLCTAFETAGGTLWANDSITEDSLQEFGVLRRDGTEWRQVESFTISWCTPEKLRGFIEQADAGGFDEDFDRIQDERFQRDHAPCPYCQ